MANEALLSAPNGDCDVRIQVNMSNQSFGDGGDCIPPGRYKLLVDDAKWENKRGEGKVGKNLRVTYTVAGPEGEWTGARIVQYMPAPTGDERSEEFQRAARQIQNLFASALSGRGTLDQARSAGTLDFAPSMMRGNYVFAYVTDDEYNGNVKSKVVFFLPVDDYTRQSGPDPLAAKRAEAARTAHVTPATTGTQAQTSPPDLLGATSQSVHPSVIPNNGASDPAARLLGLV